MSHLHPLEHTLAVILPAIPPGVDVSLSGMAGDSVGIHCKAHADEIADALDLDRWQFFDVEDGDFWTREGTVDGVRVTVFRVSPPEGAVEDGAA